MSNHIEENNGMRSEVETAAKILVDKLGEEVTVLDVSTLTSYTGYLVLATAKNDRHVKALADTVIDGMKEAHGRRPLGMEGEGASEWILVDYGDYIIHVFLPEARLKYDLDGFWRDAVHVPIDHAVA